MAQRTPMRSFLSAVPSKASADDPAKDVSASEKAKGKRRSRRQNPSDNKSSATTSRKQQPKSETPSAGANETRRTRRSGNAERRVPAPAPAYPRPSAASSSAGGAVEPKVLGQKPFPGTSALAGRQKKSGNGTKGKQRDIKLAPLEPLPPPERGRPPQGSTFRGRPDRVVNLPTKTRPTAKRPPAASIATPMVKSRHSGSAAGRASGQEKPRASKPASPLLYGARLLIVGVGIGVIAGTLLSVFDPASRYPVAQKGDAVSATVSAATLQQEAKTNSSVNLAGEMPALQLNQEISSLKSQLQALTSAQSDLTAGAVFVDLDNGAYVDINGDQTFSAASTIKVPILVAFFEDVDAGKIRLDEKLTMRPDLIAKESGDMQYQPPGTKFSALETANKMITISDNTATNMLIDRLGGMEELNQRFQSWGLTTTSIRKPLPDLEGANTTSPKDMVKLMGLLNQGKLVSVRSRDRLLDIMRHTENNSLLPKGLGEGATIAHKTGDIGTFVGDVGMIDLPSGKRYLAAMIVKGPHNDPRSTELIRQFSKKTYQYFNSSGNR